MKKGLWIFLLSIILVSQSLITNDSFAYTDEEIVSILGAENLPWVMYVNGQRAKLKVAPHMVNNEVHVNLQDVASLFGYEQYVFDQANNIAYISNDEKNYTLPLYYNVIIENGIISYTANAPITSEVGGVVIPIEYVSVLFGCDVTFETELSRVSITKEEFTLNPAYVSDYQLEDLLWLSRIVTVEARNLPAEGNLGVANVVLNRVKSDLFPNSVHDVIFQIDYHVQFPPAHKSTFKTSQPSKRAIEASIQALNGVNNVEDCLYFNNSPFRSKADDLYIIIEGEYFYH